MEPFPSAHVILASAARCVEHGGELSLVLRLGVQVDRDVGSSWRFELAYAGLDEFMPLAQQMLVASRMQGEEQEAFLEVRFRGGVLGGESALMTTAGCVGVLAEASSSFGAWISACVWGWVAGTAAGACCDGCSIRVCGSREAIVVIRHMEVHGLDAAVDKNCG